MQDGITGANTTIEYGHHETHEGDSFTATFTDSTMANAETASLAFKTGDGVLGSSPSGIKRVHMLIEWASLVGGHIQLIEGPSWTQGTGAAVNIINKKREASMESSTLLEDRAQATFTASDELISNVTGVSGGTTLFDRYAWGEKGKVLAEASRGLHEFILKPSTTYLVLFTAIGNSNAAEITLNWYEHRDRYNG